MPDRCLLFRTAARIYALDVRIVLEIMRPLALDGVEGTPEFVLGVAMIRGRATPVVSASSLFSRLPSEPCRRWIHVRAQEAGHDGGDSPRTVALAVEDVLGVRRVDELALEACAPLLQDADSGAVAQLGRLDGELLRRLSSGIALPPLSELSTESVPA